MIPWQLQIVQNCSKLFNFIHVQIYYNSECRKTEGATETGEIKRTDTHA